MQNNQQLAGAIIIAAIIIGGAILLKDTSGGPKVMTISKMTGLNTRNFNACLESGKYKAKVQADIDDGVRAGVNGTPSSFIVKDGVVVSTIPGAQPLNIVMDMIAAAKSEDAKPNGVEMKAVSPDEHLLGNTNARIVIVEYSDLECPFCKTFHNTMHEVVKSDPEVAWVFRHYPIPQLHAKALREAEATECAWEQKGNEGFWKYADKIFEITPSNDGLDPLIL